MGVGYSLICLANVHENHASCFRLKYLFSSFENIFSRSHIQIVCLSELPFSAFTFNFGFICGNELILETFIYFVILVVKLLLLFEIIFRMCIFQMSRDFYVIQLICIFFFFLLRLCYFVILRHFRQLSLYRSYSYFSKSWSSCTTVNMLLKLLYILDVNIYESSQYKIS